MCSKCPDDTPCTIMLHHTQRKPKITLLHAQSDDNMGGLEVVGQATEIHVLTFLSQSNHGIHDNDVSTLSTLPQPQVPAAKPGQLPSKSLGKVQPLRKQTLTNILTCHIQSCTIS